tara:strand:- start:282 stop:524 length:243 start_codon:yes stop_codon:yes gene_type:complete
MSKSFNIFNIVNITVFLISLLIGLIYLYFDKNKTKIYVYPTPNNYHNLQFQDKAGNCFAYELEKTKCPTNKKNINNIPIQ